MNVKNVLYKIGCKREAFALWGFHNNYFCLLSKDNIKAIKTNYNKATEEEKSLLKKLVNEWCEVNRCPSLYID